MYLGITVNIAVFNEERRIGRCLSSIFQQNYPHELLEVLIIDGMSTDRTVEIAKQYPVRILTNAKRDPATGRTIGLLNSSMDLHIYFDADMALSGHEWFKKMVKPLIEDPKIAGSFTRFLPDKEDPPLNRCLSYNEQQLDPMLEFISPRIRDTVFKTRNGYKVCYFRPGVVPVLGVIMFRSKIIKQLYRKIVRKWKDWMWSDVDFPIAAAEEGFRQFAYVPDAGIYHRSYLNLSTYLQKKRRDVYWSYLSSIRRRYATYINFENPTSILKMAQWLVYANLFFPGLIKGVLMTIRKKDIACMYLPILITGITDYVLLLFLKDKRGRTLIRDLVRNSLR